MSVRKAPGKPAPARAFAGRGNDPLFAEPWEAEAFAILEALARGGICTHPEWSRRLTTEIARPGRRIDSDPGRDYYLCWLAALEKLCVEKSLTTTGALKDRKSAWREAYEATAHGSPVSLENAARIRSIRSRPRTPAARHARRHTH